MYIASSIHDEFSKAIDKAFKSGGVASCEYAQRYLSDVFSGENDVLWSTLQNPVFCDLEKSSIDNLPSQLMIGDKSLILLVMFQDLIAKRGVSERYYCNLGAGAYLAAAGIARNAENRQMFAYLGNNFKFLVSRCRVGVKWFL